MKARSTQVALALVLAATAACGGRSTPPATPSVRAYVAALRADDPRAAYDLMSDDAQDDISFDDFAVQWKEHAAERAAQAAALEDGLRDQPDVGARANVTLASGSDVPLARDHGAWHIDAALVTPSHASRAIDAFRQFAAAVQARDLEALLGVLTERRREGLAKQLDGFFAGIDGHLGNKAQWYQYPDRAELRWSTSGLNYKIIARKEGEVWRIDDVDVSTDDGASDSSDDDSGDGEE